MRFSKTVLQDKKTELENKLIAITERLSKCESEYEDVKALKKETENRIISLEDDINRMS